ncbi:MAG: LuxR C-terminal-related transcriptional regulator [Planctomycetota bacterium]
MDVPPELNWLAEWVAPQGTYVWVCDPEQRLVLANDRAHELLGRESFEGPLRFCHGIVAGLTQDGKVHCQSECEVLRRAREGKEIEPLTISVRQSGGDRRWVQLFVIPVHDPEGGGPWLVHYACDVDRLCRLEQYLRKVALRSATADGALWATTTDLTEREREVLKLLALDVDPHGIAKLMHVSYATVRNHIQHLLPKLGVHSIQEAVAVHLLGR